MPPGPAAWPPVLELDALDEAPPAFPDEVFVAGADEDVAVSVGLVEVAGALVVVAGALVVVGAAVVVLGFAETLMTPALVVGAVTEAVPVGVLLLFLLPSTRRSEERRVGKEC